jgi:phage terminase Nu1 subunit (DNA packaging protein)
MNMFEKLKEKHTSSYVKRSRLYDLTGGIIAGQTMAIFDSKGTGIKERMIIGKETAYSLDALIKWLENNTGQIKKQK